MQKVIYPAIVGLLLCLYFNASAIHNGQPRDKLIAEIGEPQGEMKHGTLTILTYDGGVVELENGIVSSYPHDFQSKADATKRQRDYEEQQRAKGLEFYNGQWMRKEQIARLKHMKEMRERQEALERGDKGDIKIIRNKGANMAMSQVIVLGKITIVDFFADWCGPCKRLSPYLEEMVHNNPTEACLRKIDIVNWNTPIVKQYNIKSIPNVRIYDRNGRPIGTPTSSLQEIVDYIELADKR